MSVHIPRGSVQNFTGNLSAEWVCARFGSAEDPDPDVVFPTAEKAEQIARTLFPKGAPRGFEVEAPQIRRAVIEINQKMLASRPGDTGIRSFVCRYFMDPAFYQGAAILQAKDFQEIDRWISLLQNERVKPLKFIHPCARKATRIVIRRHNLQVFSDLIKDQSSEVRSRFFKLLNSDLREYILGNQVATPLLIRFLKETIEIGGAVSSEPSVAEEQGIQRLKLARGHKSSPKQASRLERVRGQNLAILQKIEKKIPILDRKFFVEILEKYFMSELLGYIPLKKDDAKKIMDLFRILRRSGILSRTWNQFDPTLSTNHFSFHETQKLSPQKKLALSFTMRYQLFMQQVKEVMERLEVHKLWHRQLQNEQDLLVRLLQGPVSGTDKEKYALMIAEKAKLLGVSVNDLMRARLQEVEKAQKMLHENLAILETQLESHISQAKNLAEYAKIGKAMVVCEKAENPSNFQKAIGDARKEAHIYEYLSRVGNGEPIDQLNQLYAEIPSHIKELVQKALHSENPQMAIRTLLQTVKKNLRKKMHVLAGLQKHFENGLAPVAAEVEPRRRSSEERIYARWTPSGKVQFMDFSKGAKRLVGRERALTEKEAFTVQRLIEQDAGMQKTIENLDDGRVLWFLYKNGVLVPARTGHGNVQVYALPASAFLTKLKNTETEGYLVLGRTVDDSGRQKMTSQMQGSKGATRRGKICAKRALYVYLKESFQKILSGKITANEYQELTDVLLAIDQGTLDPSIRKDPFIQDCMTMFHAFEASLRRATAKADAVEKFASQISRSPLPTVSIKAQKTLYYKFRESLDVIVNTHTILTNAMKHVDVHIKVAAAMGEEFRIYLNISRKLEEMLRDLKKYGFIEDFSAKNGRLVIAHRKASFVNEGQIAYLMSLYVQKMQEITKETIYLQMQSQSKILEATKRKYFAKAHIQKNNPIDNAAQRMRSDFLVKLGLLMEDMLKGMPVGADVIHLLKIYGNHRKVVTGNDLQASRNLSAKRKRAASKELRREFFQPITVERVVPKTSPVTIREPVTV